MNKENFEFLGEQLKYLGFGEDLKALLEQLLTEGQAAFQLPYKTLVNKIPFEAVLNFRRSDTTHTYFFNTYHASLSKASGEKPEQTFYINKGRGVTRKEAFNLLDGRAVLKDLFTKEGEPYKAWIQLDFENKDKHNNFEVKHYYKNYGFDLKAAVEKFRVADMEDPEKEKVLLQSLQKGNLQAVAIVMDGKAQTVFLAAEPRYKKINVYDASMQLLTKDALEQYKAAATADLKEVKAS
ncbi:MAG: hypothetical protein ABIX01_21495 [Chitinophagaceae bacterium]